MSRIRAPYRRRLAYRRAVAEVVSDAGFSFPEWRYVPRGVAFVLRDGDRSIFRMELDFTLRALTLDGADRLGRCAAARDIRELRRMS